MHWLDPDHPPETSGVVDCFLLNGEGEAAGLVRPDGTRHADGSDGDRVGVWPEKGIVDTQHGPNRNGHNW